MGNAEYMGTHPIFESDFDCLTDRYQTSLNYPTWTDSTLSKSSTVTSTLWVAWPPPSPSPAPGPEGRCRPLRGTRHLRQLLPQQAQDHRLLEKASLDQAIARSLPRSLAVQDVQARHPRHAPP